MAINGVLRPGHVAIRVREIDPAVRHYTEVLGLIETARRAGSRVFESLGRTRSPQRRLAGGD
jgi:catechol 2,3-dioxygenase